MPNFGPAGVCLVAIAIIGAAPLGLSKAIVPDRPAPTPSTQVAINCSSSGNGDPGA